MVEHSNEFTALNGLGIIDFFETERIDSPVEAGPESVVSFLRPTDNTVRDNRSTLLEQLDLNRVQSLSPPWTPVNLRLEYKLQRPRDSLIQLNARGRHTCDPQTLEKPTLTGGDVQTYFTAHCESRRGGNPEWKVVVTIYAPKVDGKKNKSSVTTTLYGEEVDFDQGNTRVSLGCREGEWQSHVLLKVKENGDWWLRRIYENSFYQDISCPSGD